MLKFKMIYLGLFLLHIIASCSTQARLKNLNRDTILVTYPILPEATDRPTRIIETFVDSTRIGLRGKSKIEIIKHQVLDQDYLIIRFYIRLPEYWAIQNTYLYETNAMMGLQPEINDFNNDGLNDITIISGTAVRGANEIRRLFIYNEEKNVLTSILNSEEYPNMEYNKELDCIDAFAVYGGCSTIFLRIKEDSLKKFAEVQLNEGLTISEFSINGKEKIIYRDTTSKANFIRYKNYKPLEEYIEKE